MENQDPSNMKQMIEDYPAQFGKGLDLTQIVSITKPINKVIITGMGGSALAGDLINSLFSQDLPDSVRINRTYTIQDKMDANTLVIAISYSGNTEETLSAFNQAVEAGAQVVAVACGGELPQKAIQEGREYIKLTKDSENFQPRMSSGYTFSIICGLLIKAGWLPEKTAQEIRLMADSLPSFNTEIKGQQIGESLLGTIPLIYTSDAYWPVARIAKIKLNENAKIPAFWNYLPELNHNELVGFTNTKDNFRILMFRDPADHPRINQRMEVTSQVLKHQGIGLKSTIWDMQGETKLQKTFSTLMMMDWASYYLALAMHIDPTPVDMVEDFKKALVWQTNKMKSWLSSPNLRLNKPL